MIKSAMKYIADLVESKRKIESIEIKGATYTECNLSRIDEYVPRCECLDFTDLDGMCENVAANLEMNCHNLPLTFVVEPQEVRVYSHYDVNKKRELIFRARSQHPSIPFGQFLDIEHMVIVLQTCFEDSDNKNNLIQLISNISKEQKVSLEDDGITQKVVVREGITTKQTVAVPPLIRLAPFRSFYELERDNQLFLLRVDRNGRVALFDADGGSWKHWTQKAIRSFLEGYFLDEIAEGKVIIG